MFKAMFRSEGSILVGRSDVCISTYTVIMSNHSTFGKMDKKEQTWLLLAVLNYWEPVQLRLLGPLVPPRPLVFDAALLLIVMDHCFLDNDLLVTKVKECLCGVNFGTVDASTVPTTIAVTKCQVFCRMEQKLITLPNHVCGLPRQYIFTHLPESAYFSDSCSQMWVNGCPQHP